MFAGVCRRLQRAPCSLAVGTEQSGGGRGAERRRAPALFWVGHVHISLTLKLFFNPVVFFVVFPHVFVLTGIKVLDTVVDRLIKGPGPKKNPRHRGYTDPKLSATIHKLTGLTLPELRMHWHMQVAYDLLHYTDLPLQEIMNRCGYTSMPTFSRTYRRWWHTSPQRARIAARNRGDIGKYAL